jgi:anti-anti-sigma factor
LVEDVPVVSAAGRLGSVSAPDLARTLADAASARVPGLAIDLSEVDYISSACVGVIDRAALEMATAYQIVVMCGLAEPVRLTLQLSGLLSRLAVEPSRAEAVMRIRHHRPE